MSSYFGMYHCTYTEDYARHANLKKVHVFILLTFFKVFDRGLNTKMLFADGVTK